MGTIRFSDGESFDTDGDYRVERRKDGYYVVGNGMLCPVDSYQEGDEMVKSLKAKRASRDS